MPRVLVTGTTGLVGRNLLSLAPAIQWRAAIRRRALTRDDRESIVIGNIDAGTDWSSALLDIDSVVHLAARVHIKNPTRADLREFESVNVAGTARLAIAAAQAGVKRFIFLSTVKVNGEVSGGRAFRVGDPANPSDAYARSKFQSESELARIGAESGMQTLIIRAPLVYGPGVRANFLRLLSWVHRGLPMPLGSINNSRSLVSVWNLCDLIHTMLRHPQTISGAFMVSDGHDISTPQLIRLLAGAMQRSARLLPVPLSILRIAGRMTGASEEIDRLCSSLQVEIGDTRDTLNWSPPVTLESGLSRTVDWYLDSLRRDHG